MQQEAMIIRWLREQATTHPRVSPGLVVARLALWGYTFVWGLAACLLADSLGSKVYSLLPILRDYDNQIGVIAMLVAATQIARLILHHKVCLFGLFANTLVVFWYMYLLVSMIMTLPPVGPTYTAAVTLMVVLSTVSVWNDPWINGKQ